MEQYDFDGLYFDFWYGKMVCENWRHGCGGRFRTYTILGAREMMAYAYNLLKAKNPHAIIKANTNLLSTALLTSFIDLRLVGESRDITALDADSRRWLYSSYRLGEPTDILWAKTPWNDVRKASFAALINFLPQYYHSARFSPREGFDDFDVFRYFGAETGTWHLGMQGQSVLPVGPGEVVANVVEKPGEMLATLINTSENQVAAEAPLKVGYLAYDPMAAELFHGENGSIKIELDGWAHRNLVFLKKPGASASAIRSRRSSAGVRKVGREFAEAQLLVQRARRSVTAGHALQHRPGTKYYKPRRTIRGLQVVAEDGPGPV